MLRGYQDFPIAQEYSKLVEYDFQSEVRNTIKKRQELQKGENRPQT